MPLECKPDLAARILIFTLLACGSAAAQQAALPPSVSEIPETFKPKTDAFDFIRREEMLPMRDGVKLKTIILVPKGAKDAPILLARTPYDAAERLSRTKSPKLASVVPQMMDTAVDAGYIIAYQDVRGKHGSEGDYVMTQPLRGPLNKTATDHATDCYDTIEWLVKNVRESNGRVGTIGGSYEGYTTVMSTVNPHPALKAAVPFAPMVDGWMGDDWFHNGAFRAEGALEFTYNQQATRGSSEKWWSEAYDSYDTWLRGGSAGAMAASHGLEQTGFWRQLAAHPAYDAWWQEQAVDRLLAKEPITVPMMIVGGLFDQEDIYGAPALYKALAPKDPEGKKVHLVLGPWNHGQGRREGRGIGMVQFAGDTAGWFRREVMQPFLDHYLKDAPQPDTPRVLAYETGADTWHRYDDWPRSCAEGLWREAARHLPPGEGTTGIHPTLRPASGVRRIPFGSGEARALSPAPHARLERDGIHLGRMANGRPAPGGLEAGRSRLRNRDTDGASPARGRAARTALRVHDGQRRRLGRENHRCLARGESEQPEARRLPADDFGGYFSRTLSRGFLEPESDRAEQGARILNPVAAGEPHVLAWPPDNGADPVQLVPALRPQSAVFREEHHVCAARELHQGDAPGLADIRPGVGDRASRH